MSTFEIMDWPPHCQPLPGKPLRLGGGWIGGYSLVGPECWDVGETSFCWVSPGGGTGGVVGLSGEGSVF